MHKYLVTLTAMSVWSLVQTTAAHAIDLQDVNTAELSKTSTAKNNGLNPLLVRAQLLLDRAGFSPGEIDGRNGDNFKKAMRAFAKSKSLKSGNALAPELWAALVETFPEPALVEYTITEADVKGPFLEKVPTKMEAMQGIQRMSYGSVVEELAEKFHMSEGLLKDLNAKTKFEAGETIAVANIEEDARGAKVAQIEIDKSEGVLRAFKKDGSVAGVFPATVGSTEKPAPSGRYKVTRVAQNPTYRYNPDYAFKGVKETKPFTINPGPNNPVGVVWIALSIPSYGIHGTPNPSQVGKTESHGCVRLTNWDARKLASMVDKNTTVDFVGNEKGRSAGSRRR
jgi:lipoprotein-anchoring transpeptidase ErfK/SrfK